MKDCAGEVRVVGWREREAETDGLGRGAEVCVCVCVCVAPLPLRSPQVQCFRAAAVTPTTNRGPYMH